jgi:hypothetical protein
MDNTTDHVPPSYDNEEAPSYEHAPSYDASPSYNAGPSAGNAHALSTDLTLALDPTGMFIKQLPSSAAPPIYTLSTSLLHVDIGSSVHVKRPVSQDGEISSLAVYAIGDRFISPLKSRNRLLQNITVARSSGLLAAAHLREIVWDFYTFVVPKERRNLTASFPAVADAAIIGLNTNPYAQQKHLLRLYSGKWVDENDEVLALDREGGAECEGMPVLSVTKHLDQEMMDLLISAWCVTMWGDVGKRARRLSGSSRRKLSIGKFKLG